MRGLKIESRNLCVEVAPRLLDAEKGDPNLHHTG